MENKVSSRQKNFRSSKLLSVHVQVYVFRRESLNFENNEFAMIRPPNTPQMQMDCSSKVESVVWHNS